MANQTGKSTELHNQEARRDSNRRGPFGSGIFFFRHGKTALNADANETSQDRIRGWVDVPLDQEGIHDAILTAQMAPQMAMSKLYSSDLRRAMQTAQAITQVTGLEPVPVMALRPWNLGQLQGQLSSEAVSVIKRYVQQPDVPVPGGESFNDFVNRFIGFIQKVMDEFMQTGQNIGCVSHYRDFKLLEAWLHGNMQTIDMPTFFADNIGTSSVMLVSPVQDGQWGYKILQTSVSQ